MLVTVKAGGDAAHGNVLARKLSLPVGREQGWRDPAFFHAHTQLFPGPGTAAFGKANPHIPGTQHFPRTMYFRILRQQREHQDSLEKSVPGPNREKIKLN